MDVEKEDYDKAENETKSTSKKPRKRKKQQYNEIRQQIEFYFSDASLSKDRFLKKLISEDPGLWLNFTSLNIPESIYFI